MSFIKGQNPTDIILPTASCYHNCSTCSNTASKKASQSQGEATSQNKNGYCGNNS